MRYLTMLLMLVLAGCAYQTGFRSPELSLQDVGVVAVVPFENLSGYPDAGIIVAELFQANLSASGAVRLATPEVVKKKMESLEGKTVSVQELGEALGAQMLVLGRVTEYTYKHTLGMDPAVGISVRLVDAQTGRVFWHQARSQTGRYSCIKQDCLSRLAQVVCDNLVKSLLDE